MHDALFTALAHLVPVWYAPRREQLLAARRVKPRARARSALRARKELILGCEYHEAAARGSCARPA